MEIDEIKKIVRKAIVEPNIIESRELMMEVYDHLCAIDDFVYICGIKIKKRVYKNIGNFLTPTSGIIQAIKYLRNEENLGLKEAKDIVEYYRDNGGKI